MSRLRPVSDARLVVVSEQQRHLVPAEVGAVVAIAIVSLAGAWPERLPVVLPLFVAASVFRWVRGRPWAEVIKPMRGYASVSALAGALALAVAVLVGSPAIEALFDRAVEWSMYPIVRGSANNLFTVAVLVALSATAAELVFHGWIVDRVVELSGGRMLAVLVGAGAEALAIPGTFESRLGAGVFGAALGWMYLAGGRSLWATIPARVVFAVGAVVLEALRLVG
jgi:hypothetical protein